MASVADPARVKARDRLRLVPRFPIYSYLGGVHVKPVRRIGVLLAVLLASVVLPVAGAAADTSEPVELTGPSQNWTMFPRDVQYVNRGGWSGGNKFVTNPNSQIAPVMDGATLLSETYVISEPYVSESGSLGVSVSLEGGRPDSDGPGGLVPVRWVAVETVFYCKSSVTGVPPNKTMYSGRYAWDGRARTTEVPVLGHTAKGCDGSYLNVVAIEFFAHTLVNANETFEAGSGNAGNTTRSPNNPAYRSGCILDKCDWVFGETMRTVWYPGLDLDYTPFDNMLTDYGDDEFGAVCVVNPAAAQCDVVNRWAPYQAAASFDKVCAGAPGAVWNDWSWIPEWMGHYTRCLFVPKAGFPVDPVRWELENSSLGEVFDASNRAVSALPRGETCGVIFDSDIAGVPFRLDTCAWSAWSSAKQYIGMAMMILAGVAGLNLLVGVFTNREMRPGDE